MGLVLGLIGTLFIGVSVFLLADSTGADDSDDAIQTSVRYEDQTDQITTNRRLATLTPTPTLKPTPPIQKATFTVTPSAEATNRATPTVTATGQVEVTFISTFTNTSSISLTATVQLTETPPTIIASLVDAPTPTATPESGAEFETDVKAVEYIEPYTSTNQVGARLSAETSTEDNAQPECPTESTAFYDLIPIEGQPMSDHPDYLHADLNLALRGFVPVTETLELRHYNGSTDVNAPRLHGLFEPNRIPEIKQVYQINEWLWEAGNCDSQAKGCRGGPIDVFWPVTLAGFATAPGEQIYIPERNQQIYSGGFMSLVLYAEPQRITLGYTRRDNVTAGYVVHVEGVCVDPNLLALYQAQKNIDGWHTSGFLPALRNNQALGVALESEIRVAIRDVGSFMDPRSHKDWWVQ